MQNLKIKKATNIDGILQSQTKDGVLSLSLIHFFVVYKLDPIVGDYKPDLCKFKNCQFTK